MPFLLMPEFRFYNLYELNGCVAVSSATPKRVMIALYHTTSTQRHICRRAAQTPLESLASPMSIGQTRHAMGHNSGIATRQGQLNFLQCCSSGIKLC